MVVVVVGGTVVVVVGGTVVVVVVVGGTVVVVVVVGGTVVVVVVVGGTVVVVVVVGGTVVVVVGGGGGGGGGEIGGGLDGGGVGVEIVGGGRAGSCFKVGAPGSNLVTAGKRVSGARGVWAPKRVPTGVNDDPHVTLVWARLAVTFTGTVTPGEAWSMGKETLALPVASAVVVCTLWVLA